MQALEAEYEAQRNGEAFDRWNQSYDAQAAFRESLGDADYEQYLQARGGESTVTVREVIGSSPANSAGMMPGDRILSYDGDRVFNMFELKSKAFAGNPGDPVRTSSWTSSVTGSACNSCCRADRSVSPVAVQA
jgi:S1-C subfamily serine protease